MANEYVQSPFSSSTEAGSITLSVMTAPSAVLTLSEINFCESPALSGYTGTIGASSAPVESTHGSYTGEVIDTPCEVSSFPQNLNRRSGRNVSFKNG